MKDLFRVPKKALQTSQHQPLGAICSRLKDRSDLSYYTDKKENQIFHIYKEIQKGAVAKSYMNNGLLIYGEIFAHFLIY
jgi:hypothetical protein